MGQRAYKKIEFHDKEAELVSSSLEAPGSDEILIEAECSLISPGTERAALIRVWDDPDFRRNPGYALAGRVIEAGPEVDSLSSGDRVISLVSHASHVIASAAPWVTLPVPDALSMEEATFVPLASVALHAIRRADVVLGETMTIIGAGIVGQLAITLARMQGARRVIVLDLNEGRLERARGRGADVTINPQREDSVQRILEETDGEGSRVILEATGNTGVIPQTLRMAAVGGRIVCLGIINEEVALRFHKDFMQKELTLMASTQPRCPTTETIYYPWTQQANRRLILDIMSAGEIEVDGLLTHRFPASEARRVYGRIKDREPDMLGVLLEWS
jgi:2-desacetyl-2-hydroxyethyl bacteriochlorophyllide A dehydrogenase